MVTRVLVLLYTATAVPGAALTVGQPGGAGLRTATLCAWALAAVGGTVSIARGPRTGWVMSARASGGLLAAAVGAFAIGTGLVSVLLAAVCMVLALVLLGRAVRPASPRLRRALLTAHVVCSGTWLGVGAVMVTLTLVADAEAYRFLELFDETVLPLASVSATLTGVFLAYVTRWGVLRHYWVLAKLVLAIGVFVAAFAFLHGAAVRAAAGDPVPPVLVGGFGAAFLAIVAATVISVYKPWGRIRRFTSVDA